VERDKKTKKKEKKKKKKRKKKKGVQGGNELTIMNEISDNCGYFIIYICACF
jgi:hypothetical protein